MVKLILPKTYLNIEEPLIFLAGPILSAPLWQDQAITFLHSQDQNIAVASPRRGVRESIASYIVEGDQNYFPRQRVWEKHYLGIASKTGAIMFWLPGENEHNCNKVYGATTRMEFGQWITNYSHNQNVRFCVGTDGTFPEVEIMEYDLLEDTSKKMCSSLEETCAEAIKLAKYNL